MVKQVKPLELKEEDTGSGGKMPQPNSYETQKFLTDLVTKSKSQQISDSEFFDEVGEIFISNPEFFMTSIYPKMESWNYPSFLNVKEDLFELLRKEGASI